MVRHVIKMYEYRLQYSDTMQLELTERELNNMPMQGSFDAQQFAPKQVGTTHPTGKFPATITNTSIEPTKNADGGMFIVEFTTQAGSIVMRYNLWNPSAQAVSIAQGQLSALCHATGIFKLDWANDGAALKNAHCQIEVVDQIDKQTKQPNGYTQVAKVYDANGNEPGKPPQQPQVQPQQGNGATAQQWGNAQQQAPQPSQQAPGPTPWGNQGQSAQPTQANPGWSQGPNVGGNPAGVSGNPPPPPWASK